MSPADFNAQLGQWIAVVVNGRWRRHLEVYAQQADRIGADRAAMVVLPPVPPDAGWHRTARLPRDRYVRLDAQRLLGESGGDRTAGRGDRGPGPGPGDLRRPGRG